MTRLVNSDITSQSDIEYIQHTKSLLGTCTTVTSKAGLMLAVGRNCNHFPAIETFMTYRMAIVSSNSSVVNKKTSLKMQDVIVKHATWLLLTAIFCGQFGNHYKMTWS